MTKTAAKTVYLRDYTPPDYLMDSVNLCFKLEESATFVQGTLSLRRNPHKMNPAKDLFLHGEDLELVSIMMDDKQLSAEKITKNAQGLTILDVPTRFTLKIHTKIYPQLNTALSGLYQSLGNFCTQCEAEGFRRIMYYLDRPDVMATFTTEIIADKKKYPIMLSNGNCIERKDLPDGRHYIKWEDPYKKPSYLFALVAGDFEVLQDNFMTAAGKNIHLNLYVEKNNLEKTAHAMQALKKAMRWDEEQYGREYDLDNYMIVAVSDFNMGAMENKGLNIFNTQYILAHPATATDTDFIHVESVIAHEYFHNWTGNRITCRDWFQLSLKEGLTVFRDQCFTADTTSKTVARIDDVRQLRNTQFIEDNGPLAHSVRPDSYAEINNFYTATIYNKGAELIRMQRILLGHEMFRKGMDLYFQRFDGQAVTIEDFIQAMEDASDISLKQFRYWYTQAGTPQLMVKEKYDADKKQYYLDIRQHCAPTPGQNEKKPFHIPIKIGLLNANGEEIHATLLHLKKEHEAFCFEKISEKPILSFLRDFSAPVRVNFSYSAETLLFLFKHDTNLFNRWEAGQNYALHLLLSLIEKYPTEKPYSISSEYQECFTYLINTMPQDKFLLSEFLTLPAEKYIGEALAVVDVDAIHAVREEVLKSIATNLKGAWLNIYAENFSLDKSYQFNTEDVGRRRLLSIALNYLNLLQDPFIHADIILPFFHKALPHNMTDTMSALTCLVNSPLEGKEEALALFYETWQHEALVMDKWFSLQALAKLPDTFERIVALTNHKAFDLHNPNKVYALIGAFTRNAPIFHAENGAGYLFLQEIVIKLDKINPQVAARMIKPFSEWRRYDTKRQHYMQQSLQTILRKPHLSKDVSELAYKSLV